MYLVPHNTVDQQLGQTTKDDGTGCSHGLADGHGGRRSSSIPLPHRISAQGGGGGGCIDKKVPVVRNFTSQCRVSYYLDGTGSAVLEANTVEALVEVDGVLPRHNLSYN